MPDSPLAQPNQTGAKVSATTWIGLFIALFGMLIARQAVNHFYPVLTFTAAIWKESLIWLCAIALLFVIARGERLPFSSVGIGTFVLAEISALGCRSGRCLRCNRDRHRSRHPL